MSVEQLPFINNSRKSLICAVACVPVVLHHMRSGESLKNAVCMSLGVLDSIDITGLDEPT